jgi:hypothetical protein
MSFMYPMKQASILIFTVCLSLLAGHAASQQIVVVTDSIANQSFSFRTNSKKLRVILQKNLNMWFDDAIKKVDSNGIEFVKQGYFRFHEIYSITYEGTSAASKELGWYYVATFTVAGTVFALEFLNPYQPGPIFSYIVAFTSPLWAFIIPVAFRLSNKGSGPKTIIHYPHAYMFTLKK